MSHCGRYGLYSLFSLWAWPRVNSSRVLCNRSSPTLQGMAFTLEERLQLGIHGLLPPCFLSQDVQVLRVMKSYETRINPLDKWDVYSEACWSTVQGCHSTAADALVHHRLLFLSFVVWLKVYLVSHQRGSQWPSSSNTYKLLYYMCISYHLSLTLYFLSMFTP